MATANYWTLTQTSDAVWQALFENRELAQLELRARSGEALTGVDSLQYAAFVWLRLEQVWTAYDLRRAGVFSDAEMQDSMQPTRVRAEHDQFWKSLISDSPMPSDLKAQLLATSAK